MDTSSRKIVEYIGNMKDIFSKLKTLENKNKSVANSLGKDFDKNLKTIGDKYKSIAKTDVKKLEKNVEELKGSTSSWSQTVQGADGKLGKLTRTIKVNQKGVSSTTESYRDLTTTQSALLGKSSQLASNFNKTSNINRTFAKNLTGVGHVTNVVSKNLTEMSGGIKKTGAIVKTSNGRFLQLRETISKTPNGIQQVSRSVKDVTKSFVKADTKTVSLGQNMARLAKRAALTIPIWFALRGAISGVSSTFKNGIRDIAEFDRKLQKARRNLRGTPAEIESNFKTLRSEVTKLSLESGKSVEEITDAFQKFATVGLDYETSMTGATEATKLAVTLFGDTEKNANALARTFRILSDEIDDGRSKSEQLREVTALLNELWKDQAFEIDEMASALERFSPIAKVANFTMAQSVQALAAIQTAGIRQTRAGRLLGTAVLQMDKNFDKLQSTLGLNVNPQMTTTFERLKLVAKEIGKLQEVDTLAATQALQELFGGVRGAQVPAVLATNFKNFLDVLTRTGDVKGFNKEYEEITKTTGILTQRITNLNKEIGKTFVSAIVGGDDFDDSLAIIVETLEDIKKPANDLGIIIRNLLKSPLSGAFLGIGEIIGKRFSDAANVVEKEISDLAKLMIKAMEGELEKAKLHELLMKLLEAETLQLDIGFDQGTISRNIKTIREQLIQLKNEADDVTITQKEQISKTQIDKINRAVIKSQLEQLKAQGTSVSQLIKRENKLEEIFGINKDLETSLDRQLSKERALKEEKRLQAELGNDAIKLFRIAEEHGTRTAKKISEVLAGDVDFSTFIKKGGEVANIFKKEFANIFEQQQAKQFFRGETVSGIKGLRGGAGVTIQEESIRGLSSVTESLRQSSKLQAQVLAQTTDTRLTPEKIQDLQVARMNVTAINLPVGGGRQETVLGSHLLQSRQYAPTPGALTNANVVQQTPQQSAFTVNFKEGAFIIHGTPDKATQDEIKKSVTSAIQDFQNKLVGKQTNTL